MKHLDNIILLSHSFSWNCKEGRFHYGCKGCSVYSVIVDPVASMVVEFNHSTLYQFHIFGKGFLVALAH